MKSSALDALGRVPDLSIRSVGTAEEQVLAHGGVKEENILEHGSDLRAQIGQRKGTDVVPANEYAASLRIVKTGDQIGNGGFAGAGGAYKGDNFAGVGIKVDAVKHGILVIVSEGDILKTDVPGHGLRRSGFGGVIDVRFDVKKLENTVGACRGLLQNVVNRGELEKRLVNVPHVDDKDEEIRNGNYTFQCHFSAAPRSPGRCLFPPRPR